MRTSQQDERLRTLRLEREFQRRAEEALTNEEDDDDDDDEEEEHEDKHDEDDGDNVRVGREGEPAPAHRRPSESGRITSGGTLEPRMNGGGPPDEERARKVDEIRRKQQELEATKEAEERLLREAQRRQQEEQMRRFQQQQQQEQLQLQQQQQQQQQQGAVHHYQHQHHASQRLDSLVAAPHIPQYSNGLRGPHGFPDQTGAGEGSHRYDPMTSRPQHSPVPPERGSSYSVMQQQQQSSSMTPAPNNRFKGSDGPPATVKRVQFSETTNTDTHITYDNNANQEKVPRQDPNVSGLLVLVGN